MRILLVLVLLLSACDQKTAEPPPPAALTAAAIGHYCNMPVAEHPGPKGQIFLRGQKEPVWFTSVRDTLAFTMLPEEPKDLAAVYVTAMDRAATWDAPGPQSWVDGRKAFYVAGSDATGGMGQREVVPFAARPAAEAFAARHGGSVAAFDQVPREQVLGDTPAGQAHSGGHR